MTILRVMDNNAEIITHSDLLYLIKTIEKTSATQHIEIALRHPSMFISMISNCLKLASRLIDPDMADRWKDLRAREVCVDNLFGLVFIWSKLIVGSYFWKKAICQQ